MTKCDICGVEHLEPTKYGANETRILATTFPKTGTNMLIQLLGRPEHIRLPHNIAHVAVTLNGLPVQSGNPDNAKDEIDVAEVRQQLLSFNGVAFGHVPYQPFFKQAIRSRPTVVIFLIRDPRDVIVSHYHHVKRQPDASMNYVFADGTRLADRIDPLGDLIKISRARWTNYMPWLAEADLVIRYEEMRALPLDTCRLILAAVGTEVLRVGNAEGMLKRLDPSISPTFRKGGTGDWQELFTTQHMKMYSDQMSDMHEALGYAE